MCQCNKKYITQNVFAFNLFLQNYSIENFDYDENRMTYYSFMVLNQPSHLDTGFYYCAPMSESIDYVKKYKNIYIYVKGNILINNIS